MQTRTAQKYFKNHLAELHADFDWIRANTTREDKDFHFFEADTTTRVHVLLQALNASESFRTKVTQNLARHFDIALDWAEKEIKALDAAEIRAASETCRQAHVEDSAHRTHRKKVLGNSSRSIPKTSLPELETAQNPRPLPSETMTIRDFCEDKKLSGVALNRAMERIRKRLEAGGTKPVLTGRCAKMGQSPISRRYAISDLTKAFHLDRFGNTARK